MFCQKCGKEISNEAVVCVHCGCAVDKTNNDIVSDKASAGLIVLSILFPLVGIILWPVKHKDTPKAAKTYGIVGIISWALSLLFSLLSVMLIAILETI